VAFFALPRLGRGSGFFLEQDRRSAGDREQAMSGEWPKGLCVAACLFVVSSGCGSSGPELGQVTGTVTMDGQPVPGLNITFAPAEKGPTSVGGTNQEGRYKLLYNTDRQGAVLGKHNVIIRSGERDTDEDGKPTGPKPVKIPAKYSQAGELTADVKAGSQEINFELDSKK
jgi:hypothetical protein